MQRTTFQSETLLSTIKFICKECQKGAEVSSVANPLSFASLFPLRIAAQDTDWAFIIMVVIVLVWGLVIQGAASLASEWPEPPTFANTVGRHESVAHRDPVAAKPNCNSLRQVPYNLKHLPFSHESAIITPLFIECPTLLGKINCCSKKKDALHTTSYGSGNDR